MTSPADKEIIGDAKSPNSSTSKWWTKKSSVPRNTILRGLLVSILLSAAVLVGTVGYYVVNNQETKLFESEYRSLTGDALKKAELNMKDKSHGIGTVAHTFDFAFPDAVSWPNVTYAGFEKVATEVRAMSGGRVIGFIPILLPSEVEAFEQFSFDYFDANPDTISPNSGYHETSGRGIWAGDVINAPDQIVRDVSGYTFWGSQHLIVTPVLQVNDMDDPIEGKYLLVNAHAGRDTGGSIDKAIECSQERQGLAAVDPSVLTTMPCAVVSDIVGLVVPSAEEIAAESVIVQPIYPANDPTEITGVIMMAIRWADMLKSVVPEAVSGIIAVVASETVSYTYEITNGTPRLLGIGDLHPKKYSSYANGKYLDMSETLAIERSAKFTITFYPSDALYNKYHSNRPLYISLSAVGIILFALLTFLVYDHFMIRDSNEQQVVLDTKRQFVRYISHEVRTPLNTVSMGIKLLLMEMQAYLCLLRTLNEENRYSSIKENEEDASTASQDVQVVERKMALVIAQLEPWVAVVEEVGESVEDATVVLNDLLNYDKIEMGTLKLEVSAVDMWSLLSGVVRAFDLHAKKAGVSLVLLMDIDASRGRRRSSIGAGSYLLGSISDGSSSSSRLSTHMNVLPVPSYSSDHDSFQGSSLEARKESKQEKKKAHKRRKVLLSLRIMGDPTRLQQVVRNLVSNALKFTPTGGTVTVRARWVEDGLPFAPSMKGDDGKPVPCSHPRRGSLRVTVTDTGAGLNAEQLKQIFGEGVQFNPNVLQAGQGSGLGLFIAKGIAIKHQGVLSVHSEGLGHGTIFALELPTYAVPYDHKRAYDMWKDSQPSMPPASVRRRSVEKITAYAANAIMRYKTVQVQSMYAEADLEQSPSKAHPSASSSALTIDAPRLSLGPLLKIEEEAKPPVAPPPPARLLVVDDAASNRKMLIRILKNKGFECVEATNGQEALDEFRAAKAKLLETRSGSDGGGAGGDLEPFAAILMDFEMPVMNGPTATRHLREQEGCRVLIAGITGNVLTADVDHYKAQGANAVLPKPLNVDAFMELYENFLVDAHENALEEKTQAAATLLLWDDSPQQTDSDGLRQAGQREERGEGGEGAARAGQDAVAAGGGGSNGDPYWDTSSTGLLGRGSPAREGASAPGQSSGFGFTFGAASHSVRRHLFGSGIFSGKKAASGRAVACDDSVGTRGDEATNWSSKLYRQNIQGGEAKLEQVHEDVEAGGENV